MKEIIGLSSIDNMLKNKREFLFSKYKEYFDKTDWHCKSNEMLTELYISINEEFSIWLEYNNFFNIWKIEKIREESPKILITWLNEELEKNITDFFLDYKRNNIKILNYIYVNALNTLWYSLEELNNLLQDRIDNNLRIQESISNNWKLSINEVNKVSNYTRKSFFFEFLYNELYNTLFKIEDNIKNFDIVYELEKRNKLIDELKDLFNTINNNDIKSIYFNIEAIKNSLETKRFTFNLWIYSYVFWPNRMHNFIWKNSKELEEKIDYHFDNNWDFNIDNY